jgi:hypothetical protein
MFWLAKKRKGENKRYGMQHCLQVPGNFTGPSTEEILREQILLVFI